MSGQLTKEGQLPTVSANETAEGITKIPVVRGSEFVRLAPNTFTAWHVPGDGHETRFSVYL